MLGAHPGLCHPEGSGVHPQEQDPLSAAAVTLHVTSVRVPGVLQRVVHVLDRPPEGQLPQVGVQLEFHLQKPGGGGRVFLRRRSDAFMPEGAPRRFMRERTVT